MYSSPHFYLRFAHNYPNVLYFLFVFFLPFFHLAVLVCYGSAKKNLHFTIVTVEKRDVVAIVFLFVVTFVFYVCLFQIFAAFLKMSF